MTLIKVLQLLLELCYGKFDRAHTCNKHVRCSLATALPTAPAVVAAMAVALEASCEACWTVLETG